jgi:hypothetical protein
MNLDYFLGSIRKNIWKSGKLPIWKNCQFGKSGKSGIVVHACGLF